MYYVNGKHNNQHLMINVAQIKCNFLFISVKLLFIFKLKAAIKPIGFDINDLF